MLCKSIKSVLGRRDLDIYPEGKGKIRLMLTPTKNGLIYAKLNLVGITDSSDQINKRD